MFHNPGIITPSAGVDFIEGDIFSPETLEKAGVKEADALAGVSKSDDANRRAVDTACNVFKVEHVMSRVSCKTQLLGVR